MIEHTVILKALLLSKEYFVLRTFANICKRVFGFYACKEIRALQMIANIFCSYSDQIYHSSNIA